MARDRRPRTPTRVRARGRRRGARRAGDRHRGFARCRRDGGGPRAVVVMRAPSSRSTRAPASTRSTRRSRGGAAAAPASAASMHDPESSRSVDRPVAPELGQKSARGEWDGVRDLARQESGLDHHDVPGNRTSTAGARGHPRDTARRHTTRLPERDPFLAAVGSLRNLVLHYARTATWTLDVTGLTAMLFRYPRGSRRYLHATRQRLPRRHRG